MGKQLADRILEYLSQHDRASSLDLVKLFNEDHQKIVGAIKSLDSVGELITIIPQTTRQWEVTPEGQHVKNHGSHEAAVYNAVPENGILQAEIMKLVPFAKVGLSKALAAGWIELDKNNGSPIVKRKALFIKDSIQDYLKNVDSIPDNVKADFKKRKLLHEVVIKSMLLEKGPKFSTKVEKLEADLTADLLANGAWKDKKFKPYNFDAFGSAVESGHLHPLLKVRSEFRKIFLEMGFSEMPTNNYVESSFWNFDALFQPQQHPARDAHDTFFISEPRLSTKFPMDYLEKVKKVHSEGGYGSQGYQYEWKIEEAQKNLLRTHTTAVSARMLYKLMQQGNFQPAKYFSIDRVFRNETLDATHLAEFHQVEGVIADYNLTLGDLIGVLYEFFEKLGIMQLQFKPAYNPYTEPSMEIFCYHPGLQKWIEIGNSGMFRPELLLPMDLPRDVNVIAWGLSLERPTMIKYGLNNIRDLVGPRVDMEMVHNNPICRLEKTSRQIIPSRQQKEDSKQITPNMPRRIDEGNKHKDIDKQVTNNLEIQKQNLTIFCDPNYPVYSLEKLLHIADHCLNISVSSHIHSTVTQFSNKLKGFCSEFQDNGKPIEISINLIWKVIGIDPIMLLPGMHEVRGEINIIRYLNRIIERKNPNLLKYEFNGILYANQIDSYLESLHRFLHGTSKILQHTSKKGQYIMGDQITIADILLESIMNRKIHKL